MSLLGGQLRLLARRQFRLRRHDDDVALLALVESLGAQHDIQRLVPGHVLQAQRHAAVDRVADHDVLAAGVGQQLQHRARLDVLEVQRQPLAGVHRLLVLRRPRSCAAAGHFDHVLIVGLVGELLEVAGGVDDDARAVAGARDVEAGHRRAEVVVS